MYEATTTERWRYWNVIANILKLQGAVNYAHMHDGDYPHWWHTFEDLWVMPLDELREMQDKLIVEYNKTQQEEPENERTR